MGDALAPIAPMLASPAPGMPEGDAWVFEPKYDGIRVIGYALPEGATLFSRNGRDKSPQFPEVAEALAALARTTRRQFVIDGEIVALHDGEAARFQDLQSRMHVTDDRAIAAHRANAPVAFQAFDLLLDGDAVLVDEPWRARRQRLEALVARHRGDVVRLTPYSDDGAAMLAEADEAGWEGIIAKAAEAKYRPGARSRDWLKVKLEHRQEFVVGGYTEPRNSREHIGAILLGYYDDDGDLVYAGHTGGGFSRATLADMHERLRGRERATSPFSTTPKTNETPHWVTPRVVVEVRFNEWTADGRLRQPIFLGVRDDKDAAEVRREPMGKGRASKSGTRAGGPTGRSGGRQRGRGAAGAVVSALEEIEASGGAGTLELPTGALDVSNLGKVYFPRAGHTKGDLMRYYAAISPHLLPAIADRALVMKRYPGGITEDSFYQQKAPDKVPDAVRVETVEDDGIETARRLVGGDIATLIYLVQLGAISVDPWHSRVDRVTFADYSIIDLDPGPKATFGAVVETALAVKEVLDQFGLHAVPKTSGASGMHIVLPLPADVPNDGARMIAELIATMTTSLVPKRATIERTVNQRPATAIYVDYLQNIRGKTVAGVYSARAEPTATVSTPLAWEEVNDDLDPKAFTIETVPPRVAEIGDLWGKGMRKANRLERLIGGAGR